MAACPLDAVRVDCVGAFEPVTCTAACTSLVFQIETPMAFGGEECDYVQGDLYECTVCCVAQTEPRAGDAPRLWRLPAQPAQKGTRPRPSSYLHIFIHLLLLRAPLQAGDGDCTQTDPVDCVGSWYPDECATDCAPQVYLVESLAMAGGNVCPHANGTQSLCAPGDGDCVVPPQDCEGHFVPRPVPRRPCLLAGEQEAAGTHTAHTTT